MDYIVNYYEIEVLSPTTVTSGNKIPGFQVAVQGRKAYIIDIMKMIKENQRVLRLVETFDFNSNQSFLDRLKTERIDYKSYVKYELDYFGSTNRIIQINEIMKTAGRPYIPGSSIKGAVRSMLSKALNKEQVYVKSLEDAIKTKEEFKRKKPNREFDASTICDDKAEEELFGSPNYSPFRFLNISDTDVVSVSNLELCDVKVLNICGEKAMWFAGKEKNIEDKQWAISIHTEALKSGTKLNGKISSGFVQYFKENKSTGIKNIDIVIDYVSKIKREVQSYIASEIEFYKKYNKNDELTDVLEFYENLNDMNMKLKDNEFILQVGFSTGYKPKSVIKNINKEFIQKLKVVSKGKVYDYMFPKTRRLLYKNGRIEAPLGWIKITLLP